MSGISGGGNLANLDMQKLETYVDQTYDLSQNDPTIVILNPSSSDKILYNGNALTTPQSTLDSTSWSNDDFAGADASQKVLADEDIADQFGAWPITPDWQNPLEYLTETKLLNRAEAAYGQYTYADLYQFDISSGMSPENAAKDVEYWASIGQNPLGAFAYLSVEGEAQYFHSIAQVATNTWNEDAQTDKSYVLATAKFEYNLDSTNASTRELAVLPAIAKITTSGGESDPTSPLVEHYAAGSTSYLSVSGGGLDLINYNPGDFGIGTPPNGDGDINTEKDTEYEVLKGWAQGNRVYVPAALATVTFGTSPEQLGAVIDNYNPNSPPIPLYDPSLTGDAYNRPTLDLASYLLPAGSSSPTNDNGNGNGGDNGGGDNGNATVDVLNFLAAQPLLDGLFDGFSVDDTAANVSTAFDELNDDSKLTAITLTDSDTPTLTLTAAQALNDTTALADITNPDYGIDIVDTCANVSASFDELNDDETVTAITLTDADTASLTLTAAQVLEDTTALREITNPGYTITVFDSAENISSVIDALNDDPAVTSIVLSDSDTPTLSLSVTQTLDDTAVLDEIANASYGINVEDTAANILGNASALSADPDVTGAVVVDSAADVLNNATALNADTQVTSITVADSVANIFANLDALQADAQVTSLVAVDTAANIVANAAALAAVPDVTGTDVVDTAADVSANIDALNADASLGAIMLTDSGTPSLTLTVAQAIGDTSALAKVATAYAIDVVDTAAAVAANIDAVSQVAGLAHITLTDGGTPTLTLTAAQAVNDAGVIGLITNSNVQVVISDTAANVAAQLDALNADPLISAIVLTDAGTPRLTLTVAQALGDATALGKIANTNVQIAVSDTAADVAANFDALDADAAVSSIALTDAGTPTLGLTVAQAIDDTALLAKISNPSYTIAVFDSVANILANAGALGADAQGFVDCGDRHRGEYPRQ